MCVLGGGGTHFVVGTKGLRAWSSSAEVVPHPFSLAFARGLCVDRGMRVRKRRETVVRGAYYYEVV